MNTKRNAKITIVTVCYNAEKLIEKTLKSVIEQSYSKKEYVVIDGASTDSTKEIIQSYSDYIDIYISKPDRGIYHAMNKAVHVVSGQWIIFMNAGDIFVNNQLLEQVSNMLHEETNVLYGDILTMKDGELTVKKAPVKISNMHRMPFCHQAVFTRTSLLKTFPFDEKYQLSADFKLYKQLKQENIAFDQVSFPITIYDRTGLSNSQRSKGLAENIAIIKEVDTLQQKLRLLPRLYFVKNWNTLRQKLKSK
ncbi:MAG: glycosyltransferase family 2 protein [Candidatus Saccharimonadaceae bacterium]